MAQELAIAEAKKVALEQVDELPYAIVKAGEVGELNLTPIEQDLYNLILRIKNVFENNGGAVAQQKQQEHDGVKAIIEANPGANLQAIEGLIDAQALDILIKLKQKAIAKKIMEFAVVNVDGFANGQQEGMGIQGKSPKDILGVSSLENLKTIYGLVNRQEAIDLVKDIIIHAIKNNVENAGALNGPQIANMATQAKDIISNDYVQALATYDNNKTPIAGESEQEKAARQAIAVNALNSIDEIVKTKKANVNQYLSAYRVIARVDSSTLTYPDAITGRFDIPEALGLTTMAILDTKEIKRVLLTQNSPATPKDIFNAQKENVDVLLKKLAVIQRTYHLRPQDDRDVGTFNEAGNGPNGAGGDPAPFGNEHASCPHGSFVRIIDVAHSLHPKVNTAVPTVVVFGETFSTEIKRSVKNLSNQKKQEVINFYTQINDPNAPYYTGRFVINGNNFSFHVDEDANQDVLVIPNSVKKVLTKVTESLAVSYNFLAPDPRLRIMQQHQAVDIINNSFLAIEPNAFE